MIRCIRSRSRTSVSSSSARLVRFTGVGHLPMLEQADAVNEALGDLLRRSAARGRGSLRRLRRRA